MHPCPEPFVLPSRSFSFGGECCPEHSARGSLRESVSRADRHEGCLVHPCPEPFVFLSCRRSSHALKTCKLGRRGFETTAVSTSSCSQMPDFPVIPVRFLVDDVCSRVNGLVQDSARREWPSISRISHSRGGFRRPRGSSYPQPFYLPIGHYRETN